MKNKIFGLLLIIVVIICINDRIVGQTITESKFYLNEWKKVDTLESRGLPKSALEIAEKIYAKAKQENNAAQFIKSIIYKLKLQSEFEEDYEAKAIENLDSEILNSQFPIKPILQSMVAELYKGYYNSNRYKLLNRSVTQDYESKDIRTWDVRKLVQATYRNYAESIKDAEELKKININLYDEIIIKGEGTRQLRPTLYDFLCHRALDYFINEETYLTEPAYKFEIDNPVYFSDAGEFGKQKIESQDSLSKKLYALKLLQELTAFHQNDANPQALIDIELKRLEFVKTNSIIEMKDSLYLNSLIKLKKKYDDNPYSADIIYKIAEELQKTGEKYNPQVSDENKWDIKKAYEYCEEAIKKYPGTDGAKNCRYLEDIIREPSLSITNEEANLPDTYTKALIRYRNTEKINDKESNIYLRMIKIDYEEEERMQENMNVNEQIEKYIKLKPDKEWLQTLPDDGDFQQHSAEIKLPKSDFGYYVILVSTDKSFNVKNHITAINHLWVTNISYIQRKDEKGNTEFYLLHRDKGTALSNVKVQTYHRNYDYTSRRYTNEKWKEFKSDKDGYFQIPPEDNTRYYGNQIAEFITGKDRYVTNNFYSSYYNDFTEQKTKIKTFFFTDRAIYRPGQTIYFKGIMLYDNNSQSNKWSIAANQKTTVTLYDVNYKEAGKLELVSNDYGSINGSFTAPSGVLTGQMQISNKSGTVYFSVEEYKRPKFEVKFDTLKESYKLGDTINVVGKAKSYAGSNIDNAEVKYRVVRETRFPFIYDWWWNPFITLSEEMQITSDTKTTDEKGEFTVKFNAIPDKGIDKKYKPVFNFTVYADVTDINGETHSTKISIPVAYTSVIINTEIPDKIDKTKIKAIKVRITNLNGTPLKLKDTAVVYKLKQPDRILRKRLWEMPDRFAMNREEHSGAFPYDVYDDEDNISKWDKEKTVKGFSLTEDVKTGNYLIPAEMMSWQDGTYMLEVTATDNTGEKTSKQSYFTLYSSGDNDVPANEENWFGLINDNAEPGEKASFMIGSKDDNVKVLYEIEQQSKIISKKWINLKNNKQIELIPITENDRGNISIHLTFIKHNRSYSNDAVITVPFTNKQLDISFESFRNKLLPGENEEWKIILKDKKGEKVAAEMLATMYDASLDVYRKNNWGFDLYRSYYSIMDWGVKNSFETLTGQGINGLNEEINNPVIRTYDKLNWYGFNNIGFGGFYGRGFRGGVKGTLSEAPMMMKMEDKAGEKSTVTASKNIGKGEDGALDEKKMELAEISSHKESEAQTDFQIRKNFNETAFFYPDLQTNDKGEIMIKFTISEALTRWKMMGLAYTEDLKYGKIEKELVTQKTLMITTNPPRFFREGDKMDFSAKITNMSDNDIDGQVELNLYDAVTMSLLNNILNGNAIKKIKILKGQSIAISWNIIIPEGIQAITYSIKAAAGSYSDGEEMTVPVFTNRMLVTETMPLPIRGKQTKTYNFDKLSNSGKSTTLKNYRLTLEFTSNPAWYAIQALPYLMEPQYESSENLFERFYANSIASFIVNFDSKIKRVFDIWKNYKPETLLSNLDKNQDLKNIMLQETPWVMEANDESARKQRVALLFDLNKMTNELNSSLYKLQKLQSSNGGWPWFAGMPESKYFTLTILAGIGHLKHLGIDKNNDISYKNMVSRAVYYIDDRMGEEYNEIKRLYPKEMDKSHISSEQIQYLYTRSYFENEIKIRDENKEAFLYFKGQARKYWTQFNNYLEGMIALSMHRYKDDKTANDIIKSLKEKSIYSDEMGMYWKHGGDNYYWYQAPVETQALMIEAFDEVAGDIKSVEDMKAWLLKQKQTRDWKTSKATAEACYALLLRGINSLASDKLVDISIGKEKLEPLKTDDLKPEAGTGYFRTSWFDGNIKPEMGKVKITKQDEGVAWGGLYWQYFEQLDNITGNKTPLSIDKKLFIEKTGDNGPYIEPVREKTLIKTGDKIKVRIEIRSDREMEYIHLKDMRASGLEPVTVISSYKYKGGLGYYESTSDAATNFFIQYLNKGTYVFEYDLIAAQTGNFSNGITSIQCLYAPEFSSNSEGIRINIVK